MKRLLLVLCAAFAAFALDAQDLVILHFNDTHSHIDPQRSGDYKGKGRSHRTGGLHRQRQAC